MITHSDWRPMTPEEQDRFHRAIGDYMNTPQPTIDDTLADRQKTHGQFDNHAWTSQGLKAVMHGSVHWSELTNTQREALEMVAHKIGRILNGDPNFHDHWHDCMGYLRLVEQELQCTSPT